MTDITEEDLERRSRERLQLASDSSRDPSHPVYWIDRFNAMDDDEVFDRWAVELAAVNIPATSLNQVFRYLRNRINAPIGAIRQDYNRAARNAEFQNALIEEGEESHWAWTAAWIALVDDFECENGLFWFYDEIAGVWEPQDVDEVATMIARDERLFGPFCKTHPDYRAIAKLAYTSRAMENRYPFKNAPIGLAAGDKFYRVVDGRIVGEPLTKEHFAKFKVEVDPAETWRGSLFEEFILQTFPLDREGNADQVQLLKQHFGAALFGLGARMQKVLLWQGPGATGKSATQDILKSLFPDQVVGGIPPDTWGQEYHLAMLAGKKLNLVGEIDYNAALDSVFKNVTGGGTLTARHPTHKPFEFVCEATHVVNANASPATKDRSDAFWRRWSIVRFEAVVPPEKRRLGIGKTIVDKDLGSVLRFAFEGIESLAQGVTDDCFAYISPALQQELVADWRLEVDTIKGFLTDNEWCILDKDIAPEEGMRRTPKTMLYDLYSRWCRNNGVRPIGSRKFAREMRENIFEEYGLDEQMSHGRRYWVGVGIVADHQNNQEVF